MRDVNPCTKIPSQIRALPFELHSQQGDCGHWLLPLIALPLYGLVYSRSAFGNIPPFTFPFNCHYILSYIPKREFGPEPLIALTCLRNKARGGDSHRKANNLFFLTSEKWVGVGLAEQGAGLLCWISHISYCFTFPGKKKTHSLFKLGKTVFLKMFGVYRPELKLPPLFSGPSNIEHPLFNALVSTFYNELVWSKVFFQRMNDNPLQGINILIC